MQLPPTQLSGGPAIAVNPKAVTAAVMSGGTDVTARPRPIIKGRGRAGGLEMIDGQEMQLGG